MKFIVNLNGIIQSPYQILLDISHQIPNNPCRIEQLALAPICDLYTTNDWINLESYGNPVAIRAKLICDFVYSLLQTLPIDTLTLEIHIQQGPLLSDNLFCLIYLAQHFKSLEVCLYTDSSNLIQLKQSCTFLHDVSNCSIAYQTQATKSSVKLLNQLHSKRMQALSGLGLDIDDSAFRQQQIDATHFNQLIAYCWLCLKAGGSDIACYLLTKLTDHVGDNTLMQEQVFMHLLLIRFFSHQYTLIANTQFPKQFSALEQSEINTLQFLKAYSATVSNNIAVAGDYFAKCCINEDIPLVDENSLYQLNLFASYKMLQKEVDKAFELEFRIKQYMDRQQIDTVGMRHVNYMEIARLYAHTKQHQNALEYYNRAYKEISDGGYTTSDHIYYNLNLGSLYEQEGNYQHALLYWIKTALHWLACNNKYELAWRPRLILCQENIEDITQPLPMAKANKFLLDKIEYLLQQCNVELASKKVSDYYFIDDTYNIRREQCFIHKNILVYTGVNRLTKTDVNILSEERQLNKLISNYIHTVMDIPEGHNLFIIDTHLDTKFLRTDEQAMSFARLSNCSSCYFNGQWIKLDDFHSLAPMIASLSKVIDTISETEKGLVINYKRSFLNKTILERSEIDLVKRIEQSEFLSLDRITNSMWNNIHQLARKRILRFAYSS